ncbi:MAG: hypothetical protein F6K41_09980 [Symploca sp. SIO3E6]|nr:hypothetical protein [Caldora sp. SIO3E6]
MVELPDFLNRRRQTKTERALCILENINTELNKLLHDLNVHNTSYLTIKDLLEQIFDDINDATKRLEEETIRIGILGGRGSGKSTLANALMGNNLLPESAIVFCTSIPTAIRYNDKHTLEVSSQLEAWNINKDNISPDEMRSILNSICQQSENRNNEKEITDISIGVPSINVESKEIVDVPGFTKGNFLHQAFAEKYAKYYCDVCLVLINNSESVEINSLEGLEALTETFKDRLDSVAFIINKCDDSSDSDIEYLKEYLSKYLHGSKHDFFKISAKNSLTRISENSEKIEYEFTDLISYLGLLSSQKIEILVKSLSKRLIKNFESLRELCSLSNADLDELSEDMNKLIIYDFNRYSSDLKSNISKNNTLEDEPLPSLEIKEFNLPNTIGTRGLFEYAERLIESLSSQSNKKVSDYAQKYQANIYRQYNSRFESELGKFNHNIKTRIIEFEKKFGISSLIPDSEVNNVPSAPQFNPSQIEKLKPASFRIWLERISPDSLNREVKFWNLPFSIETGLISFKVKIPIGLKPPLERIKATKERLSNEALSLINEYLYDFMNKFMHGLDDAYVATVDKFLGDWEKNIQEYIQHVEAAKLVTDSESLGKIDEFIEMMKDLHTQITPRLK